MKPYLGLPDRERAWACVENLANEPHDLSTSGLPANLARELLATKTDLIRAYELKVEDFARETRRATVLQKMLDSERQAVKELWQIVDEYRAKSIRRASSVAGTDTA